MFISLFVRFYSSIDARLTKSTLILERISVSIESDILTVTAMAERFKIRTEVLPLRDNPVTVSDLLESDVVSTVVETPRPNERVSTVYYDITEEMNSELKSSTSDDGREMFDIMSSMKGVTELTVDLTRSDRIDSVDMLDSVSTSKLIIDGKSTSGLSEGEDASTLSETWPEINSVETPVIGVSDLSRSSTMDVEVPPTQSTPLSVESSTDLSDTTEFMTGLDFKADLFMQTSPEASTFIAHEIDIPLQQHFSKEIKSTISSRIDLSLSTPHLAEMQVKTPFTFRIFSLEW